MLGGVRGQQSRKLSAFASYSIDIQTLVSFFSSFRFIGAYSWSQFAFSRETVQPFKRLHALEGFSRYSNSCKFFFVIQIYRCFFLKSICVF